MRLWITLVCAAAALAGSTTTLHADTAAELLEKGIYNEETVGDLDAAIKLYRSVVSTASETERIAANAQFRLAQCLLRQEKKTEAIEAYKTLVENYPDQKELVAIAKQHLPNQLQLGAAPWKNGEQLTLTLTLPGGQKIGLIGTQVHSDGDDNWEMTIRRFVAPGQNEGVSLVRVEKSTNRPLETRWEHTVLGTTNAQWSNDKLVISKVKADGSIETTTVDFDEIAYSNDQWFYGFRQLPLEIGYQGTIPIRVEFTGGNAVDMEVKVKMKEVIETAAGTFDCFRLETNIAQTFWIADVPERYIVKFEAGGVEATLTGIHSAETPTKIANEKFGAAFTLPAGWYYHALDSDNEESVVYNAVAPYMASAALSIKAKSSLDSDDQVSIKAWAESKLKRAQGSYREFTLREEGVHDAKLAGADAKTFVGDYEASGARFTQMVIVAFRNEKAIATGIAAKNDIYAKYQTQFQSLRDSITVD